MMLSPAKALRYGSLSNVGQSTTQSPSSDTKGSSSAGVNSTSGNVKSLRRSLGNGYTLDLTESIPHVVKDGYKLVRNCSTGKTVYWVCRKRKYGCPKYVHTDSAGTFIKKELGEHNHEPNMNPATSASGDQNSQQSGSKPERRGPKPKTISGPEPSWKVSLRQCDSSDSIQTSDDQPMTVECANQAVSSVLAKSLDPSNSTSKFTASDGSVVQLGFDDLPDSKTTLSFVSRKRKLNAVSSKSSPCLKSENCEDVCKDGNSDMVLDLSSASAKTCATNKPQLQHRTNSYTFLSNLSNSNQSTLNISSTNANTSEIKQNGFDVSGQNSVFPSTDFQPVYHKFTKAIKAINCAGRKFRRLDPATSEGLLSWRCSQKFCRYTLYTDDSVTEIVKSGGKHNHEVETTTSTSPPSKPSKTEPKASPVTSSLVEADFSKQLAALANGGTAGVDLAAQLLSFQNLQSLTDIIQQSLKFAAASTTAPAVLPEITNSQKLIGKGNNDSGGLEKDVDGFPGVAHKERPTSPATSRVILKRKSKSKAFNESKTAGCSTATVNDCNAASEENESIAAGPDDNLNTVLDFSKPVCEDENDNVDVLEMNEVLELGEDIPVVTPEMPKSEEGSKGVAVSDSEEETEGVATAGADAEMNGTLVGSTGVPLPLPEMPDIIRAEFTLINAPDGRNHILQDGHIFSKDKCSSKSVYWRCKKKHCFAIMHTDLEMSRVSFRRGEHNHSPDPKIEQRARKGHFAKMPRKPRRKRTPAANASVTPDSPSKPKSSKSDDDDDFSLLRDRSLGVLLNNNNEEEDLDDSLETNSSYVCGVRSNHEVNSAMTTSVSTTSSSSVADDILAILSEATSDIKDFSVASQSLNQEEFLFESEVGHPTAMISPSAIISPSSFLASVMAASGEEGARTALEQLTASTAASSSLPYLNKKMINNVLSKFL